ncbi:MAG: hypothetical protein AAFZ52_16290 [Bacteroidota bacterium]
MNRLVVFLIAGTVSACSITDEVDVEAVIQERFRERIATLEQNLRDDCREDVLELASRRADSLLIVRAQRMQRIEGRPPRPSRPGAPEVKELSAPLPLRPLFPFEIRFDTLLRDSLFQDSLRLDSLERGLLEEIF